MEYEDFRDDLLEDLLKSGPKKISAIFRSLGAGEETDSFLQRMRNEGLVKVTAGSGVETQYDFTRQGLLLLKEGGLGRKEHWAQFAVDIWKDKDESS